MLDRLPEFEAELEALEATLADVYASGDQVAARDAGRRHNDLRELVDALRALQSAVDDAGEARELAGAEQDPDQKEQWRTEQESGEARVAELEERVRELLIPKDPNDGRNVIVEIRGGEGGDEANIWAGDLFRMYERVAERHGWKTETLTSQPSDMGGFREISFVVKGTDAWARMKYEGGPHRVQRVPVTESQGRVHTSAATVAILPEAEEVDVAVDPNDLKIEVYRSSGPGGQSVNTTDSAVRIIHQPSGLVVTCQDEKSQLQNKEKALRILRSRLLAAEQERHNAELSSARRDQVKGGGRSEKIRTYNFKENRVTDHRVGVTVHSLDHVLDGDIDDVVDALAAAERAEQLAS
jgi:peptide chain release factor 1